MILKVKLDKGAFAPESAHESDAGYDLRTPYDVFIPAGKFAIIDTGSIQVKLDSRAEVGGKQFRRGDKIIQIVLLPIIKPEIELVEELEETERGDGGFGSTGR